MRVPDIATKGVAFIGTMDGDRFKPLATAFFVTDEFMQHRWSSLVTAEHVISGMVTEGHDLYARVNLVNGDVAIAKIPSDDWIYYPDERNRSDVAVCAIDHFAISADGEVVPFDVSFINLDGERAMPATADTIAQYQIGVGEEVFIVGLFRSHYGKERNKPIVRTGHIAAMRDEPVFTKLGHLDAYLIEAMSIGGLSGSPVFVHMAPVRALDGNIKVSQGRQFYLLGLIHGHFDVRNLNEDVVAEDAARALGSINTGIGVVVPVEKIIETLQHPDLQEQRRKIVMQMREEEGATPDLGLAESEMEVPTELEPVSADNPNHREDFTRLVSAAAKSKAKAD